MTLFIWKILRKLIFYLRQSFKYVLQLHRDRVERRFAKFKFIDFRYCIELRTLTQNLDIRFGNDKL